MKREQLHIYNDNKRLLDDAQLSIIYVYS